MLQRTDARGMRVFGVVWLGQVVSVVGSGLASFALGVWVFERTGSVTQFALLGLFAVLPRVLLSPLAGAIVDRWDRRVVMIVADAGAGVCTFILALLLFTNELEMWHIFLVVVASAAFSTLQWPAYTATTTVLVPKKDLGRANGMVQFGRAASDILAPVLAGALLLSVQLEGVILIDSVTFLFAIITLVLVRFPKPQSATAVELEKSSLRQDMTFGWRYISARQGLLGCCFFSLWSTFYGAWSAP
jgi:DHA3 family macrolide efflux protein-like MFS transporter